jgi:hypothetical protein
MRLLTVLMAYAVILSAQTPVTQSQELTFTLPGRGPATLAQYKGHVIGIEFINSTCSHCQAAARVMTKMQQQFGARGFQALGVVINDPSDAAVEKFVKDYQVGFPVGWMPHDRMMTYLGYTELPYMPQLILIDREGNIQYRTPRITNESMVGEEAITARIEKILDLPATRGKAAGRPTAKSAGH